jgi:hypothetical protein
MYACRPAAAEAGLQNFERAIQIDQAHNCAIALHDSVPVVNIALRAGKPINEEVSLTLAFKTLHLGLEQSDSHFAGDKLALRNEAIDILAQFTSFLYFGPEHISCGNCVEVIFLY